MRGILHVKTICLLLSGLSPLLSTGQTVKSWVTRGDQSELLQQQTDTEFTTGDPGSTITLNPATTYQNIDGYGFCFTEGSAEAILTLPENQQNALLNEIFNPTTGMGTEVVRISIGASDLSSSSYTYNDNGPDPDLTNFSLAGPDLTYLIPLLKRALAMNPDMKVLATPWSAPRWMKTNNAWIGGSLRGEYYQSYANYFVKYIQAMQAEGITIWAITPQNEPENPYNEPSMVMNATEQTTFINNNLGPAFANAGIDTKIIAFDHNCDNTNYPTQVCNNSSYVDGAAFHLYGGDISAMSTVHNATNKNVYFTEQYTDISGSFSGDFAWHMQNVFIGSMNNWGKITMEWNLATNEAHGPRTPGGCTECLGAFTVKNDGTYERHVSYYLVAQFSTFVKAGAVRINSSSSDDALHTVAFENPDGSTAVVIYNNGGGRSFTIGDGEKSVSTYVPGYSAITLTWPAATTGPVTVYNDCDFGGHSTGLGVGDYTLADLQVLGIQNDEISSVQVAEGYKATLFWDDNFSGASVELEEDETCLVNRFSDNQTTSIRIETAGATGFEGTYFLENRNSGLFMDVTGGTTETLDGANIQQFTRTNATNQQFIFTHRGNGSYSIAAGHSGKVLDVADVSTENGGNIQQWTDYQADNQQFVLVPTGDGYFKLIAKHSGKLIEVAGAATAPEANVQQWENVNQLTGQWKLIPTNVVTGTGDGLRANYFNGQNFETPVYTTINETIDLDWGMGSPDLTVNNDQFSARWTGQVQAHYSGEHTFYINSDNGRRLWVNGQLLIDEWQDDWGTEYSGKINLTAGEKYDIRLDYFEKDGGASNQLSWSTALLPKEVIPQSQLYSNELPMVAISSPTNNVTFDAGSDVEVNITATDPNGSVDSVELYHGSTLLATLTSSPYTYNWTGLASGEYTISARAYDNQGAVSSSDMVSFEISDPANQLPEVTLTAPSDNAQFTTGESITLTATASDADGTIANVEFYSGSQLLGISTTSPYTIDWIDAAQGQYSLTARATDNDGGVRTSTIVTIQVTDPANQLPSVELTNPISNTEYIVGEDIILIASATDPDGTVTSVSFYNGMDLLATDQTSPFTFVWQNAPVGTHQLTATATDNDGAMVSSETKVVTVKSVTGLTNSKAQPDITLYPNPASKTLHLSTSIDFEGAELVIYDALGTVVLSKIFSEACDVSNLAPGIYMLEVKTANHRFVKRFVKTEH